MVSRSQGEGGELQRSPLEVSRRTSLAGGEGAPVVMHVCACGRVFVLLSLKEEVPGKTAEPKETQPRWRRILMQARIRESLVGSMIAAFL